jgi:uncharacterized membrane protein YphA (DoxX/SURF4 family)
MDLAISIVAYGLGALFVGIGSARLGGVQPLRAALAHFGFPACFASIVGIGEIGIGVLLLFPSVALLGAVGCACLMLGACGAHLRVKDNPLMLIPPLVLLGLALWVAVSRYGDFVALVGG